MYRLNDTYLLADNKIVRSNGICLPTRFPRFLLRRSRLFLRPLSQQAPSLDRSPNCFEPGSHQGCRVSQRHRRCEKWRQTPAKNKCRMLALFPCSFKHCTTTSVGNPLDVPVRKDAHDKRRCAVWKITEYLLGYLIW